MIWLLACVRLSPREQFDAAVAPVLEQNCASSSCHGVAPSDAGQFIDRSLYYLDVDGDGHIRDPDQAYADSKLRINTDESPIFSSLLRKPSAFDGLPHYGGATFLTADSPGYQAIEAWISMEEGGGEVAAPLSTLEQQFADTVQPVLAARGCMEANCHGPQSGVPFHLDPGVEGEFPRAATHANYAAARTMLALEGDPTQSRLLRKAQPLGRGGILHKGGNTSFYSIPRTRPSPQFSTGHVPNVPTASAFVGIAGRAFIM